MIDPALHIILYTYSPETPYLHNASSPLNLGIHLGSSFELHCVVSFSRKELIYVIVHVM